MKKVRLDQLIFEMGFVPSRERAKTTIMAGNVFVDGQRVDKPGTAVDPEKKIEVRGEPLPYVSRGGFKLEKALKVFPVDAADCVYIDCGASTGGFTDVLLQNGAKKVYAVDSGSGQLDSSLRSDERVVNIENFNARNLTVGDLGEKCDIAVTDVSFISQTLIIPAAVSVLKDDGIFVSLIKPQFECGREGLGKGGIVKSKKIMAKAVKKVIDCANLNGLFCKGLVTSSIKGGDGNSEFLMVCTKNGYSTVNDSMIKEIVGL